LNNKSEADTLIDQAEKTRRATGPKWNTRLKWSSASLDSSKFAFGGLKKNTARLIAMFAPENRAHALK
jgi:hypothetical protein